MLLIITISTFVCITFVVMALYWLVYRPQSAATERLKRLGQAGSAASAAAASTAGAVTINEERPVTDLAERIAAPINRLVPDSAAVA
ncbi:MAG TPA: hypothetical protein VM095_06475, partial [Pyrinomonadaceae bacterium]|nr:hypothetical protein [Pyrinomonadaceae bacterium]